MTVAARIEIQVTGNSGPASGAGLTHVSGKTPDAESFRSSWQEQLASLVGGADARSADLDNQEGSAEEAGAGNSHPSMAGLTERWMSVGARLGAQGQAAAGRPGIVAGDANTTAGTGVIASQKNMTKAPAVDPARIELSPPGGSEKSDRPAKGEDKKAADDPKGAVAGRVSPGATLSSQIPAGEVRILAETPINPAKAEIRTSSSNTNLSGLFTAGPMSDSPLAASRGAAASGGAATEAIPQSRPAEMHLARESESGSPGSMTIAAQDSNGIQAPPNSIDEKTAYTATAGEASKSSAAEAQAGQMSVGSLTKGAESNDTLSASAGAAGLDAARESGAQGNPPPAAELNQANTGLSARGTASVQGVKRTQHAAGTIAAATNTDRIGPGQAQFAATPADAAAMVRDPAGGRELNNLSPGGVAAGAPALRETFAALDSDAAPGALTWTHAGARQAEAGFQDPTLGWIGVRADRDGGGIHASLVPGSVEAAAELGSHLDGLNGYLAAQHTPVESLRMAAPEGNLSGAGAQQNLEHGTGQGTGQGDHPGAGQNSRQSHADVQPAGAIDGSQRTTASVHLDQPISVDSAAQAQRSGGTYISVVA